MPREYGADTYTGAELLEGIMLVKGAEGDYGNTSLTEILLRFKRYMIDLRQASETFEEGEKKR